MKNPIPEVRWPGRQRQRQYQPPMSEQQINILIRLHNAASAGAPFVDLSSVHKRTRNTLERADLIFPSKGRDGIRHRITSRGEKVMHAYLRPVKRSDGICPRCGVNPRRTRSTGEAAPYCADCERKIGRRKHELGIQHIRPGRPCSSCREKPVRQFPCGRYSTYCEDCGRERKRAEKLRRMQQLRDRVDAGEFVKCQKKGCSNPVYRAANSVYEVCHAHYRDYMTRYNDRRRPESQPARRRRYAGQERTIR